MGLKKAIGSFVDKFTRSERARNRSAKKHEESAARRKGEGIRIDEPDPVPRRASISYQPPTAAIEYPSSGDDSQSDDGVKYMIQDQVVRLLSISIVTTITPTHGSLIWVVVMFLTTFLLVIQSGKSIWPSMSCNMNPRGTGALPGGEALEDSPKLELAYQLLRRPTIR